LKLRALKVEIDWNLDRSLRRIGFAVHKIVHIGLIKTLGYLIELYGLINKIIFYGCGKIGEEEVTTWLNLPSEHLPLELKKPTRNLSITSSSSSSS
jgi:hypothetical protein